MKKLILLPAAVAALSLAGSTAVFASPPNANASPEYSISEESPPEINGTPTPMLNPGVIADCNIGLGETVVGTAKTKTDGAVELKCGDKKSGYVHIRTEHEKDWNALNKNTVENWPFWDDLMWDATKRILEKPSFTRDMGGGKRCYTALIKILPHKGEVKEYYPTVIVSINNKKVITSYPTREHGCAP